MSQPTPGPWKVHPQARTAVHQPVLNCWIPQSEADARLIAAAPEMYEALRAMVICFERFEDTHTALVMDAARAAIAKAEGKE